MSTQPIPQSQVFEGVSAALVGGGVVTMALFPLALPIIALTAVAAIPLLLPVLAAGLLVVGVVLPIMLVRSLVRRATGALRPKGAANASRAAHLSAKGGSSKSTRSATRVPA